MPSTKPSLLARITGPASPGLTLEDLMDQRAAAEAALTAAEDIYGKRSLAFAEGRPGAAQELVEAEQAVSLARGRIRAVMAARIELEAAERQRAHEAEQQAREKVNAMIRALAKDRTEAGRKLSDAFRSVVTAYDAWLVADAALKDGMAIAPHLRDVFATTAHLSASLELTRLAAGRTLDKMPPGVHRAAARDDPRTIKPLVDACAEEAQAIFN